MTVIYMSDCLLLHLQERAPQSIKSSETGRQQSADPEYDDHSVPDCDVATHYHKVPPPEDYQMEAEKIVKKDNAALSAFYFSKQDQVKKYLHDMYEQGPDGDDPSPEKLVDPFFGVSGRWTCCWSVMTNNISIFRSESYRGGDSESQPSQSQASPARRTS